QGGAAQAVERKAVDVLAKVIYADPAALVPEVLRLLALARGDSRSSTNHRHIPQAVATSGEAIQGGGSSSDTCTPLAADPGLLRVRHVLLLALHRALKGAFEWGCGVGGERGRGTADVPAHVAKLAHGLVAACFPELRATLLLLPLQQQGGGTGDDAEDDLAPLAHWQADANECLEMELNEGAGLPLKEHAGELYMRGQATHAAVLCAALHAAMEAAPEVDASQQQGGVLDASHQQAGVEDGGSQQGGGAAASAATQPPSTSKGGGKSARGQAHSAGAPLPTVRDMFLGLGGLQPAYAFEEHLQLLVEKALPEVEQRVGFLAALYAAPEEDGG
ncbi:hypothetical protein DUNSADRAFT_7202, partial [Dunaliella salina]